MSDEKVQNLRGGHIETAKFLLPILLGIGGFIAGKVFEAGRYVEQSETERMLSARDRQTLGDVVTKQAVQEIKMDGMQREMRSEMGVIKSEVGGVKDVMKEFGGKLDRIMLDKKEKR